MTRRDLLTSLLAALTGCVALARRVQASTIGVGYVDLDRCYAEGWFPATVYLDGVEVRECVRCDDREGWVEAHVLDRDGWPQIYGDGVLTERRYGKVTFIPNTAVKPRGHK